MINIYFQLNVQKDKYIVHVVDVMVLAKNKILCVSPFVGKDVSAKLVTLKKMEHVFHLNHALNVRLKANPSKIFKLTNQFLL